ncbi:MAG: hypothetical protein JW384_03875 [Nitrosomonadaceae bacterium]|nr:hypothetical protein [Nitrosomonadaceae bacterium]
MQLGLLMNSFNSSIPITYTIEYVPCFQHIINAYLKSHISGKQKERNTKDF